MNCNDIANLAPLYLSGELHAQRAAEFDAHLKTCLDCLRELERQSRLDACLRNAILAEEEVDLTRVDHRLRQRIADSARPVRFGRRRMSRRWAAAAMGIAAACAVAGTGYRIFVGNRTAPVYADAAVDHRLEVVDLQPRAWSFEEAQIMALAESQGVPTSAVEALASGSYHLERAKVCRLDGRLFLHLVFSNGSDHFSVYLRQRDAIAVQAGARETVNGRVIRTADLGGEHVALFETRQLTAIAVAHQSADAVLGFAQFGAAVL